MSDINYLTVDHLSTKDLIRIFSKIEINPSISWHGVPCWNWIAHCKPGGYGQIGWKGTKESPHRLLFAWTMKTSIPRKHTPKDKTVEIDHLCRTRACCNPVHLDLVSHLINIRRSPRHNANKFYCAQGHGLIPNNVYFQKGRRQCKICKHNWNKNYWNKNRSD